MIIFQTQFKAVFDLGIFQRNTVLGKLLIVLFVNAKVHIRTGRAEVKRFTHAFTVLLVHALNERTGRIYGVLIEKRDTFAGFTFVDKIRNIQQTDTIIDCKVNALEHAVLVQTLPEEIIPVTILCNKDRFHLPTALTFQFNDCSVGFIGRVYHFNCAVIISTVIVVRAFFVMRHIFHVDLQYLFDHILCVCGLEADFHIVDEHIQRIRLQQVKGVFDLVPHTSRCFTSSIFDSAVIGLRYIC